jgi:DNA-binding HxlR family transcriptional regulator
MGEAYEPRSGCPINATIEVFGDRWSLLVLCDIAFGDRAISERCRPAQKRGSFASA